MGIRVANGSNGAEKLRVGRIEVDPDSCLLTYENTSAKLSPRAMNVLMYLAHRAGSTVTHDELLDTFWRGSLSSKNAVHKCATELRLALDHLGDDRVQIETVPKRGYRLIAAVTSIDADVAEEQSCVADDRFLWDENGGHQANQTRRLDLAWQSLCATHSKRRWSPS